jgi:cell division inhibitor SepF
MATRGRTGGSMTAAEGREMGIWNRTLVYLGLREEPEEAYDELPDRFVPEEDPHAQHAPPRGAERASDRPRSEPVRPRFERQAVGVGAPAEPATVSSNVRPLRGAEGHVRAVPAGGTARAALVEVEVFEDVEAIGARYRTGQPVLFDLSRAGSQTARRVVDFVAGLTFALRGRLTKVGNRAFLLVPDGIELPADERRRLGELGYRLPQGSDG